MTMKRILLLIAALMPVLSIAQSGQYAKYIKISLIDQSLPKMDMGVLNEMLNAELLDAGENDEMMTFCVLNDEEWNASCTPDGHVYINYGLIKRLGEKDELLFGVLAHEIAHYMLRHHLMHTYKTLKREKLNNVGAAIGMAGTAVGNLAAASAGVSAGTSEEQSDQYQRYWDSAKHNTRLYKYRYGREEELEADIIA